MDSRDPCSGVVKPYLKVTPKTPIIFVPKLVLYCVQLHRVPRRGSRSLTTSFVSVCVCVCSFVTKYCLTVGLLYTEYASL